MNNAELIYLIIVKLIRARKALERNLILREN